MEFINRGNPIKIRIGKSSDCYWETLKTGEVIDLPVEIGLHYKLSVITTEGKIADKVVETKQVEKSFLTELQEIKGIGNKTAEDIIKIFPEREELIKIIRASTDANALPLRDDTSKILMEFYNGKQ